MKTLILQRHAKTEKSADSDLLRPLTVSGISDAAAQGEFLRQAELYPEMVFFSNADRAKQTAEIMAAKLEITQGYSIEDSLLYDCDASDLVAFIRTLPDDKDIILIVGHNPAIEIVAEELAGTEIGHFRPSEAVILNFKTDSWSNVSAEICTDNTFLPKPE